MRRTHLMPALGLLAALVLSAPAAAAFPIALQGPRVVDGDTLALGEARYRIASIDAPETGGRAECESERRLGAAATDYVRRAVAQARTVRAYRDGSRLRDRHGRYLVRITVDGRDLGRELVARGLAQPWRGRGHDWCATAGRPVSR
jgi:endonuclease YncB( thermonuclease family)